MLQSLLLGLTLAVTTISIHASCSSYLIGTLRNQEGNFHTQFGGIKALFTMAVGLLLAHQLEAMVWATAYYIIVKDDAFTHFGDAAYFSTVTFTTLGYGDIVLQGSWRLLSAFQAMTGLLVFGWSTALLFSVVERVWKRKLDKKIK